MSQLTDSQLKLVICTPHSIRPTILGSFIEQMHERKEPGFMHVKDYLEITSVAKVTERALVVLSIFETDELLGALQFLAMVESRITQGSMKVYVLSRANHPKISTLLKSKGVSDVSDFHLTAKAFQYKIRQGLDLLRQAQVESSEISSKSGEKRTQVSAPKPPLEIRWLPEVEHEDDCWLIMNPKHVRFVIGKWFVNLYGPGPGTGEWEESGLTLNGEKGWIFQPKINDSNFFRSNARWIFFGNCPEFSWSLGLWYFISHRPHFALYQNQEIILEKAWLQEDGQFGIRKNSQYAQSLQSLIQSSLEGSVYLKNDHSIAGDFSLDLSQRPAPEMNGSLEVQESIELYRKFEEQKAVEVKRAKEAYERTKIYFAITAKNGVEVRYDQCLELVALRERQAILNVPQGILETGDHISLEAQYKQGDEPTKIVFTATTRVIGTEKNDQEKQGSRVAAICELDHAIENHFVELVKMFRARREKLLDFFLKARGV